VLGLRVLEVREDDPERLGESHAQAAEDFGVSRLGLLGRRPVERGVFRQLLEDGFEFDLLVEAPELVDALLEPLGDR
jgi:hypothetical protein